MDIVLASASPRRQALLKQIGLKFQVLAEDGPEYMGSAMAPQELVVYNAGNKARQVSRHFQEKPAVIIGADTVVVLDGRVMGKPKDEEDAFRMLKQLSQRTHQVYTGVCLLETKTTAGHSQTFFEKTDVTLRALTDSEILSYIATGEPMDKAGGYGIQGVGAVLVAGIKGDYYNVMGLPLSRLFQELTRHRCLILPDQAGAEVE